LGFGPVPQITIAVKGERPNTGLAEKSPLPFRRSIFHLRNYQKISKSHIHWMYVYLHFNYDNPETIIKKNRELAPMLTSIVIVQVRLTVKGLTTLIAVKLTLTF